MKRILITGAGSFIGSSVERWLAVYPDRYSVDTIDTINEKWREADFSKYDVVFHVAGIAHVDPKPEMAPLYNKVNRDLAIAIATHAKNVGVRQFIFMSSMIVYHASKSLKSTIINAETKPNPNDFYGDSKLQAEIGLKQLESLDFKVALLRPCMIYGNGGKGNFQRLARMASRVPIFPEWHNKRSMLYIDNLCEFVRQVIVRGLGGTFHPQNREYADTVAIVRFFAKKAGKKVFFSKFFNPAVWLGSFILAPLSKMFADQYYTSDLSTYDFEYQIVSLGDSLKRIDI